MEHTTFLDTPLRLVGRNEVLQAIEQATSDKPVRLATPNPEILLEAVRNPRLRHALENMTHCIIDGSGLVAALRLWQLLSKSKSTPALYHGSDLVHDLIERYQDGSRRFFFLGGNPGIAATAAETLQKQYPKIQIVGASNGGVLDRKHPKLSEEVQTAITAASPDILFLAFGAPKQELCMDEIRNLPVPVMIGVGGSLAFYGSKPRAPRLLRRLHLEWLFRSLHEQGHWRRAFRAVVVFPLQSAWWMLRHLRSV